MQAVSSVSISVEPAGLPPAELLAALASQSRDLIWACGPRGGLVYANSAWCEYTGLTVAEHNEVGWGALAHPEDTPRMAMEWGTARETEEPFETEFRYRRHDGEFRWFRGQRVPVRDENGQITMWAGMCQDVHDRKLAEQAAQDGNRRARSILESITDAFFALDEHWRFVYVNRQAESVLRLRRDELLGRTLWDAFPDTVGTEFESQYRRSIEKQESASFESFYPPYGLWFQVRAYPLSGGLAVYFQDATEQVLARREVERLNAELESRVQERTSELAAAVMDLEGFTYSVSHDLRSPLRAIVATSRMLLEDADDSLTDEARAMLKRQASAATRMGTLVDDLLEMTRTKHESVRMQDVDLSAMGQDVAEEVANEWSCRNLRFEISPGLTAFADPRLLRLLVANLLDNAAKYSPAGGTILLANDEAGYFVRDEGIGFDPEVAEAIFEPFKRGVHADDFPGTGIGLANVRRIVDRHGGRVWAEGRSGAGATFRFWLPPKPPTC